MEGPTDFKDLSVAVIPLVASFCTVWSDIPFMKARRIVFSMADFNSVRVVEEVSAGLSLAPTRCIKLVTRL